MEIPSELIDIVLGKIEDKMKSARGNYKWKKLFVDTGDFLANNPENLLSFQNDLYRVFSKENMKDLADKLKDQSGYDFQQLLHDKLYNLMSQYDISEKEAETYIHNFSQSIIEYIQENDPDKTLEMFLSNWKDEEQNYYNEIIFKLNQLLNEMSDLKEKKIKSYSIKDIDRQLRNESKFVNMGLNFFELDDEQFEAKFLDMIDEELIFVVGQSREETVYRILNEIQQKDFERNTLIIKTAEEWDRFENEDINNHILIPFFYSESIAAIPNNTNIFVYGEDEPCYAHDKLVLRKRTQRNLISSLTELGMDITEANRLVEDTHGLYVQLKKKLFNIATYDTPEWVKIHSKVIITALLCGKWTNSEGDKLVFEELSGENYDVCKKELGQYLYLENPFIVINKSRSGENVQLASVEDAWEELDKYISDDLWNQFVDLFYKVLIEAEPLFEYPPEQHFEASIYVDKPEWSYALKTGMIRTLTMRAYYRGHDENQIQVDNVVAKVLNTTTNVKRWGCISQYILDLCEAAPGVVMDKLEEELRNPSASALLEMIGANGGDAMTGRHYYTYILWAVEQLLQQKKYAARAINWLWEIDSYNFKHSISNSPRSVLDVVFCAWINVTAISVDRKIELAKAAIGKYPNAWDVIASKLPNGSNVVYSTLNTPKYRAVDEPDPLSWEEVYKTYTEYLFMCVGNADKNPDRWIVILDCLNEYEPEIQKEVLEKLVIDCKSSDDSKRYKIKNEIRNIIYRHRFYCDADWSMAEDNVLLYENLMNEIVLTDKAYDYVYLVSSNQFPLLYPVPYSDSRNYIDGNEALRKSEIETGIKAFKENGYSLKTFINLALEIKSNTLGQVLAQFYCGGMFDDKTFHLLIEEDKEGKSVYDYIRYFYYRNAVDLREVVNEIKQLTDNHNLVMNLISLEVIVDKNNALIADESEYIKKLYWGTNSAVRLSEKAGHEVVLWAIMECKNYGTLSSFLELLYTEKEKISSEELYKALMESINMDDDKPDSMFSYYLEELLKILQREYIDDDVKCSELAGFEWTYRNILDWNSLKCLRKVMEEDPTVYARLVGILYKTNQDEIASEEKVKLANDVYEGFYKAQFCPGERDGKVEYEDIKNWVEKFKEMLISQGQDRLFGDLLGRLLVYSPIGDDGAYPCESVREIIEEYYSKSLKNAYIVAEENKRGIHMADAGKSELELADRYRKNAEKIQEQYPHTAEIYYGLYNSYKLEADYERRIAEDEP